VFGTVGELSGTARNLELHPERFHDFRAVANISRCNFFLVKKPTGNCGSRCSDCDVAVATGKAQVPLLSVAIRCGLQIPQANIGLNDRPGSCSRLLFRKGSAVQSNDRLKSCLFKSARGSRRCLCRRIRRHVGCNRLTPAWPRGGTVRKRIIPLTDYGRMQRIGYR